MKKSELNRKTKKDLLLHIENMQLMIENDHLETQKSNREMQDILAAYNNSDNLAKIQKAAGVLRYQVSQSEFESADDKKKVLKMVDNFINTVV
jgi:hypothetical protein